MAKTSTFVPRYDAQESPSKGMSGTRDPSTSLRASHPQELRFASDTKHRNGQKFPDAPVLDREDILIFTKGPNGNSDTRD